MDPRLQVVAIAVSLGLLAVVFELLRTRRLLERYALLWLVNSGVLLILAIWGDLLQGVADLLGVAYPPNALFLITFAFVLLLLLHFSLAISRLSGETKNLAQRVAHLESETRGDPHHKPHEQRGRARQKLPAPTSYEPQDADGKRAASDVRR